MNQRSRRAARSPAAYARDAGLRRLHELTVAAAVLGATGTVVLGGAAAVTYAGHASPSSTPVEQGAATDPGATGPTGSTPTTPPATSGGQHHNHSSSSGSLGQVPPPVTNVRPGNPGSGLITSGGS
ncbi:MAG: hypothetical protein ACHQZR_00090 [Candidatus Limnocylindrales bacterium]